MTGVPERKFPEDNPLLMQPEEAKYRMLWRGEWRPVTYMRDERGNQVYEPQRAVAAVMYLGPGEWQASTVRPGDILLSEETPTIRWDVC